MNPAHKPFRSMGENCIFLLSSSSERPPDARRRSLKIKMNKVNPYSWIYYKAALVQKYILLPLHGGRQMRWTSIQAEEIQYLMSDQAALTFSVGVPYTKLMTGLMGWSRKRKMILNFNNDQLNISNVIETLSRSWSLGGWIRTFLEYEHQEKGPVWPLVERQEITEKPLPRHNNPTSCYWVHSDSYQAPTLLTHTHTHNRDSKPSVKYRPSSWFRMPCMFYCICFLFGNWATALLTVAVSILTGLHVAALTVVYSESFPWDHCKCWWTFGWWMYTLIIIREDDISYCISVLIGSLSHLNTLCQISPKLSNKISFDFKVRPWQWEKRKSDAVTWIYNVKLKQFIKFGNLERLRFEHPNVYCLSQWMSDSVSRFKSERDSSAHWVILHSRHANACMTFTVRWLCLIRILTIVR